MKNCKSFWKSIAIVGCLIFSSIFSYAIPSWTRTNYTSSTAFIGIVKINEYDNTFPITVEAGDYIGAFVGEECRMIAEVFSYNGKLYVSSVIQGGDASDMTGSTSDPEEVEWKVWDNSANKLISAQVYGTLWTESAGEIFDFEIGKPNTNSDLESLSVSGFTLDPTFATATTSYEITVPYGTSLPSEADYTAVAKDSRASASVNAATSFDASGKATTTIVVTAEDKTTTEYTITFTQESCTATAPTTSEIQEITNYCYNDASIQLSASFANSSYNAVWYDTQTGGTALFTGNTFAPGVTDAGIYTYYVAKNDGTCESEERLEVTLSINSLPIITINGIKDSYCKNEDDITLQQSILTVSPEGGEAVFFVDNNNATSLSPKTLATGSHTIKVNYTDANGCHNSATQNVVINAVPEINLTSVPTSACSNQAISLTPTTGTWAGIGVADNTFKSTTDGSFELTYTETSNGCTASDAITITVTKASAPSVTPATVEKNGTVPSLQASATGTINWYETESGTSIATGSSYTPNVSTASETTFTYYVSNTENGCESEKVSVALTVTSCSTEAPEIASVDAICEGDAFPTLTATGTNIVWYDAATDGNKLAEGSYTPTAAGTYYASQNLGCEGPRASVKVEVKEKPAKPTATGASSCGGSALTALTTTEPANWYASKTGEAIATNSKSYTPSSLSATTTFYVNQTVDGCTSDFAEVVYTIASIPDKPITTPTEACFGSTAKYIVRMSGSLAAGATLQWYDEKGVAKGTESIQDVVVSNAGTYTYSVTQAIGECTSEKATATLTVYALPDPDITVNGTYCSNDTKEVTLLADITGGDFTIDGLIEESFTPSELSLGTHTIEYFVEDEHGCYGEVTKEFVISDCSDPEVETLTLDKSTLSLLKGEKSEALVVTITPPEAPQGVTWTTSDKTVAIVENGVVTAVGAGSAVITATSTYTGSKSASCNVTVVAPVTNVSFNNTSNLTLAEGSTLNLSDYLVIEPSDASISKVEWSCNSTDALVSDGIVSAFDVNADTEVTITVKVTTKDGTTKTANVNVTITNASTPITSVSFNNSSDLIVAEGSTIDLSSYVVVNPSNASIAKTEWSSNSTSATVANGVVSAGEVATDTDVQITVTLTDVDGTSKSATATVTIKNGCALSAPTVANANQSICAGSSEEVTFSASGSKSADWIWIDASNKTVSSTNTFSTSIAGTYYVYQKQGECESSKTTVIVSEASKPATPIVSNLTLCEGETGAFSANVVATWYSSSNVELATGKTYAPTTAGTYYAKQDVDGCLSDATTVTYTINEKPTITGNDETVVYGAKVPNLTVTTASSNTVTWYYNNAKVGTGTSLATNQTEIGSYVYYAIAENASGCSSEKIAVTLQISDCDLVAPVVTNDSQSICEGKTNPSFTVSSSNSVSWYADAKLTDKVSTSKTFRSTETEPGTYYYYVTQKSTCESPAKRVTFTINELPLVSINADSELTTADEAITVAVSPMGGTLSGKGVSGSKFNPAIGAGTYTLTYTYEDLNGCSNSATTQIVVTKAITIDRSQLGDTIDRANTINSLYISDNSYPATAKNTLTKAIATAQSYYDNYTNYTQAQINTQVTILSKAIQDFLNSKVEAIDLSILEAKINEALTDIQTNEYRRGTSVGFIPEASFTMLQNAVTVANSVLTNPPTTQNEVRAAVATLQSAIDAFFASEIKNKIESMEFTSSKIYMIVGDEISPELTFSPIGASTALTWKSSNTDVITVTGAGKITAKKAGSVSVTATSVDNPAISARVTIIVTEKPVLQSVSMNNKGTQLYLQFTEEMAEPDKASIFTELYIYGTKIPMYNVIDVAAWPLDPNRLVVTLGTPVDDINELTISYSGTSLMSVYGGQTPNFKYRVGAAAVDEITKYDIYAYPTQATSSVTLVGLPLEAQVIVFSSIGKKVMSFTATAEEEEIQISHLVAGSYQVMIYYNNKSIAQTTFIKQ